MKEENQKDRRKKRKRKQRGRSVQELMGIRGFTRYGLATEHGSHALLLLQGL